MLIDGQSRGAAASFDVVDAALGCGNWHAWPARYVNGRPMVWFELECGP